MGEVEKNKHLMLLLQDLILANELDYIKLIGELVKNESESLKKGYEIMTKIYLDEITR